MPTLGEELKQARENKGISLRQISDATHIGIRFLQAIEQNNYKLLPGGIFNKAFIKSFARYVGIDEEHALARYQEIVDAQGGEAPRAPVSKYEPLDDNDTSSWASTLLAAVAIIIVGLGGYGLFKYFDTQKTGETTVTQTPTPAPASSQPLVAVTPTATPQPSASPAESPSPGATGSPAASPGASPAPGATPALVAVPPGGLLIRLQAKDADCWVKVRADADLKGQQALLKPGEFRDFTATDKLVVNIGNVLSADVILNGKPARIAPNKGKFVAESILITKDNLQSFMLQ
ncbi:MAG: RodZ domain-containing protein [Blastocatellia bacterium]